MSVETSLRPLYGSFRKLGIPSFGVCITRILLFRVLYQGPLFSETPILISQIMMTIMVIMFMVTIAPEYDITSGGVTTALVAPSSLQERFLIVFQGLRFGAEGFILDWGV